MKNNTFEMNNTAADSACSEAVSHTNDSTLVGTCLFTDGYDSFNLTEKLHKNEDGSFDLRVEMWSDGSYVTEYKWAVRHRENRLTAQQADDWMNRYAGRTIDYCRWYPLPNKTFIPIDDERIIAEEHPDMKYLRMYIAGPNLRFQAGDEPFFGDNIGHSTIWPTKEAVVESIIEAAGGDSAKLEINPEDIMVVIEDNDNYREDTSNGCYVYIAGSDELLAMIHKTLEDTPGGVSMNEVLLEWPYVTKDFILKTIPEWKEFEKENPRLGQ